MAKRWYVVHAYSGFEKHVMRTLKERVALEGMEDKFGEILVPTEEVVEMRDGKKRKSERKFYPGYVLDEMEMKKLIYGGAASRDALRVVRPCARTRRSISLATPWLSSISSRRLVSHCPAVDPRSAG